LHLPACLHRVQAAGAAVDHRLDREISTDVVSETLAGPVGFDSLTFVTQSLAMGPWDWEVEVLLETMLETAEQQIPPGWAIHRASQRCSDTRRG
jgi:hypothetical protein